jgi:hypothetical protein
MVRPEIMEAYARRMVASLSADMGSGVVSIRRTMFDCQGTDVIVEWMAKLENGSDIRLSAVITARSPEEEPPLPEPSREELEELRDLGISSS